MRKYSCKSFYRNYEYMIQFKEVQNVTYITASCYNKFITSTQKELSYFQFYFIQFYINVVEFMHNIHICDNNKLIIKIQAKGN